MTSHVKVHGIVPRIQYLADGTLTEYEFPFVIFKTSDIDVYFGDSKQDISTYSVSDARRSDGGSVTFKAPPAKGTVITIVRNLSIERTTDFQEGGALRANVLNDELDYQIACQQQIADSLNRSMVLPPYASDTNVDLTLPTPSAGRAIVWNSEGTNLENSAVKINELESTLKGYKESAEHSSIISEESAKSALQQVIEATKQADIASAQAQIATEKAQEAVSTLASKANTDMDNLTNTGKEIIDMLIMPDYTSGVSKTVGISYTAELNGWIYVDAYTAGGTVTLAIDSATVAYWHTDSGQSEQVGFLTPVKKGSAWLCNKSGLSSCAIKFYPCIGA